MVYDEEKGEWVPKWGYKGKNKEAENEWLVEVPDKQWKKEEGRIPDGGNIRSESRIERRERIKRNERKMRANDRKANNMKK